MTQHLMLDLETLSSDTRAVVLTLGAVLFEGGHIVSDQYLEFNAEEQIRAGRKVSFATLSWWHEQSEAARRAAFKPSAPMGVTDGLMVFRTLHAVDWNEVLVWSNGADFDVPILYTLHHDRGLRAPWRYNHVRCFRTMKNLYPLTQMPRLGTHHNALDDARHQALHLMKLLEAHNGTPNEAGSRPAAGSRSVATSMSAAGNGADGAGNS